MCAISGHPGEHSGSYTLCLPCDCGGTQFPVLPKEQTIMSQPVKRGRLTMRRCMLSATADSVLSSECCQNRAPRSRARVVRLWHVFDMSWVLFVQFPPRSGGLGARAHEVGIAADVAEGAVLHLDAIEAAAAALGCRRLLPVRQKVPEGRSLQGAPRLRTLQHTTASSDLQASLWQAHTAMS